MGQGRHHAEGVSRYTMAGRLSAKPGELRPTTAGGPPRRTYHERISGLRSCPPGGPVRESLLRSGAATV